MRNKGFAELNSSYLLQKQPQMAAIHCFSLHPIKTREFSPQKFLPLLLRPQLASISTIGLFSSATSIPFLASDNSAIFKRLNRVPCNCLSPVSPNTTHYEFSDGYSEVELRLELGDRDIQSSRDIFVDANGDSLAIRLQHSGSLKTLMETNLYEKIKPAETIWYLDDDELVVNLKKQYLDLKWPDIVESWESLTVGVL